VDCNELYRQAIPLYQSINTDGNILLVYIEGIIVKNKTIENKSKSTMTCHFYIQNYRQVRVVPSKRDSFIQKYQAQWKNDLSM